MKIGVAPPQSTRPYDLLPGAGGVAFLREELYLLAYDHLPKAGGIEH